MLYLYTGFTIWYSKIRQYKYADYIDFATDMTIEVLSIRSVCIKIIGDCEIDIK